MRGIEPDKEWLTCIVLALDEVLGRGNEFVVAGLHAFLCQVGSMWLTSPRWFLPNCPVA